MEPRTEAGRALLARWHAGPYSDLDDLVVAIEDEAAASPVLDVEAFAKAYHMTNCPRRTVAFHSCPHRDAHRKSMGKLVVALAPSPDPETQT